MKKLFVIAVMALAVAAGVHFVASSTGTSDVAHACSNRDC